VIGVTHHQWGQVVTAIYVPSNSTVTTAELQAVLEDKLSKYKRPKYWIPLTKHVTLKVSQPKATAIATALLQNSST